VSAADGGRWLSLAAGSPASVPRKPSNAGKKSLLDRPCRYSSGNTSVIFGDLRHHAGRIAEEENLLRSPVVSSTRLSLTRDARTSTAPADVSTWRSSAWPLRTTNLRPLIQLADVGRDVGGDLGLQRRGQHQPPPSRTISSMKYPPSTGPAGASATLVTTVSTGVPRDPRWRAGLTRFLDFGLVGRVRPRRSSTGFAVCQARDPGPGRVYYVRKIDEGKTPTEARRALKRRLANVLYRHILKDQQRLLATGLNTQRRS
jgi:hypothetical protein